MDEIIEGRKRVTAVASLLSFYAVAGAAVAGAVILRRRRVTVFPLLTPPAVVLIAVALALGSNRYRASAEGALVVLAAVAIDAGLGPLNRRRHTPHRTRYRDVGRGFRACGHTRRPRMPPPARGYARRSW